MAAEEISFNSESGNVQSVSYDAETQELTVGFNHGGTYVYRGVPPGIARGFADAPSAGQYLNTFIKGTYGYERVS